MLLLRNCFYLCCWLLIVVARGTRCVLSGGSLFAVFADRCRVERLKDGLVRVAWYSGDKCRLL